MVLATGFVMNLTLAAIACLTFPHKYIQFLSLIYGNLVGIPYQCMKVDITLDLFFVPLFPKSRSTGKAQGGKKLDFSSMGIASRRSKTYP
jgi:hypothetical protein